MQNRAATVRLLSEHRAGLLLKEQPKAQGGEHYHAEPTDNIVLPVLPTPTLADLGISKMQSSRLQLLAELTEPEVAAAGIAVHRPLTKTTQFVLLPPRPWRSGWGAAQFLRASSLSRGGLSCLNS